MGRKFKSLVAALMGALLGAAPAAADGPIVVELFTSQGCSSCPPADAYLGRIADREDVIALSLHVDYWDYLGWRDQFASPGHTERQRGYARFFGERMIYTPQIVVQGLEGVVGSREHEVEAAIARAADEDPKIDVALSRSGDRVAISLQPREGADGMGQVRMVWITRAEQVEIAAGENSGRKLTYHNVVQGWAELGMWKGGAAEYDAAAPASADAVAVLVQDPKRGVIIGAGRLNFY